MPASPSSNAQADGYRQVRYIAESSALQRMLREQLSVPWRRRMSPISITALMARVQRCD